MPSNTNKASEPRLQSLEEVLKTIREFLVPVVEAVYQTPISRKCGTLIEGGFDYENGTS